MTHPQFQYTYPFSYPFSDVIFGSDVSVNVAAHSVLVISLRRTVAKFNGHLRGSLKFFNACLLSARHTCWKTPPSFAAGVPRQRVSWKAPSMWGDPLNCGNTTDDGFTKVAPPIRTPAPDFQAFWYGTRPGRMQESLVSLESASVWE